MLDCSTRYRLHRYRAHRAWIMIVEAAPRGTAVPADAGWIARVGTWLVQELDALDRG